MTVPRLEETLSVLVLCLLLISSCPAAHAASKAGAVNALAEMSIEELLNIRVTSVTKRPQMIMETAAAIDVISADEIRRSGARTIPDVLRLVPGGRITIVATGVEQAFVSNEARRHEMS